MSQTRLMMDRVGLLYPLEGEVPLATEVDEGPKWEDDENEDLTEIVGISGRLIRMYAVKVRPPMQKKKLVYMQLTMHRKCGRKRCENCLIISGLSIIKQPAEHRNHTLEIASQQGFRAE